MTGPQLKLIQIARKELNLEEERYRLLLKNVAKVESAKDLSARGFEDVMATLEDMGFRHAGKPATYWRDLVARRGELASTRAVHYVQTLADQVKHYPLPAMTRKISDGRTDQVAKLTPSECYRLTEMYKAAAARMGGAKGQGEGEKRHRFPPRGSTATLFGQEPERPKKGADPMQAAAPPPRQPDYMKDEEIPF